MRNLKKFLALVLAMLMVVSAAATVSAFEDVAEDAVFAEAIAKLNEHGIVQGTGNDEEGNPVFGYDEKVTRLQAAIFFARALTGEVDPTNEYWRQGPAQFADVTDFQYAVTVAVNAGIINGVANPDGTITFNPQNSIKYVEALKMAVCALGLGEGIEWGVDGLAFYNVADAYGLTKNVNYITDLAQELTRGEFAQIIFNMISAEYVDNGELTTLLKKVFDDPKDPEPEVIIPAEELTTFVVTATKKQYATENIGVTDGGYVGLQQLVDGIPTGDVLYVKLAELGVASDDEAEALFAKAFDLVNYNEEDGSYDRIDAHESEVTYIYNKDLTVSGNKFTYDGTLYYPVDELTGSAIRNEMVIYNREGKDLFKYEHVDNKLVLNRWGELYFGDTNLKASAFGVAITADTLVLEEYVDKAGNVYYLDYYYAKDANGKYINESGFIDEDKAAEKYGIPVDSYYETSLEFLGTSALTGTYVLVAYNDDPITSDTIDRAYFHKVWMSAHDTTLTSSGAVQYGAMKGDVVKFVDIEGNEVKLADGEVFTYFYNAQGGVVTVLDRATTDKGTIRRISTISDTKAGGYAVVITLENGEKYTLANDNRATTQGYTMHPNGKLTTLTSVAGIANTSSKVGGIAYTYDVNFSTLDARDYIEYVLLGDQIIFAAEIDQTAGYKLLILEETVDYDFEAVIADMWRVGEKDYKELALTNILYGDKYVEIASASTSKQLRIWNQMFEAKPGTVYRAYDLEDGVKLGEAFDYASKDYAKKLDKSGSVVANDFGLAYMGTDGKTVKFDKDGVGEVVTARPVDDYNVIRTDKNTIFYFICTKDGQERVEIYEGQPSASAWINDTASVYIYADKLGYSESYMDGKTADTLKNGIAGTATKVLVFYEDSADIANFSVYNVDTSVIYVSGASISDYSYNGKTGTYLDPWEYGSGRELGLDKDYWDGDYVCYDATVAIDMHTGVMLSDIYAPANLDVEKGGFYYMDDNNVIVKAVEDGVIAKLQLKTTDYTTYRGQKTMNGVEYDAVKLMKSDAVIKADNIKETIGLNDKYDTYVYTLAEDALEVDDVTFVGIVMGPALTVKLVGTTDDVTVKLNANTTVKLEKAETVVEGIDVDDITAEVTAGIATGYEAKITEDSTTNTLTVTVSQKGVVDTNYYVEGTYKGLASNIEYDLLMAANDLVNNKLGEVTISFESAKGNFNAWTDVQIFLYKDSYANDIVTSKNYDVDFTAVAATRTVEFKDAMNFDGKLLLDAGEYILVIKDKNSNENFEFKFTVPAAN